MSTQITSSQAQAVEFARDPLSFLRDDNCVAHLKDYFSTYEGRFFEHFAQPNVREFTASDFLAVRALSVEPPASAAARVIGGVEGADSLAIEALSVFDIVDSGDAGFEDWHSMLENAWTGLKLVPKIGSVTAGKLLAAKLPNLVPIYDQHVGDALGYTGGGTYWERWHTAMNRDEIWTQLESVRSEAEVGDRVSALRIVDVAIWMEQHGCRKAHSHNLRA